jgi:hypothetical protein
MKGFALGLSLSLAFILGCLSAPFLLARTSAQPAGCAPMRWEFKCESFARESARLEFLNDNGRQGWDATGVGNGGWICMKRPIR